MNERQPAALDRGVVRVALFLCLLVNALVQLLGGAMMLAEPEKIAAETFGLSITGPPVRLVAVIGGATLSYALLSGTAAVAVLKRRAWAHVPVGLLGAMLLAVGGVMLAQGMRIGLLDLVKGGVFMVGGLVCRPRAAAAAPV